MRHMMITRSMTKKMLDQEQKLETKDIKPDNVTQKKQTPIVQNKDKKWRKHAGWMWGRWLPVM